MGHARASQDPLAERNAHPQRFPRSSIDDAGLYYTSNGDATGKRWGKEDYNFVYDRAALYDGTDWSKRKRDQPFFAQFQLRGGKLRNVPKWYNKEVEPALANRITADKVTLPPYYPDHPAIREDWAQYLNSVQYTMPHVLQWGRRLSTSETLTFV